MAVSAEKRRTPPLSVKLEAALAQLEAAMRKLGMIPVEHTVVDWQLDHDPALGLRAVDEETSEHRPHQHDVRFLVWRPRAEHAVKTTGRRGESDLSIRDGDQGKIAKNKRRDRRREAESSPAEPGRQSPKRAIQSRPPKPKKHQARATGPLEKSLPPRANLYVSERTR